MGPGSKIDDGKMDVLIYLSIYVFVIAFRIELSNFPFPRISISGYLTQFQIDFSQKADPILKQ